MSTPSAGCRPVRLLGGDQPLCRLYDVALLDLDGVVYVGDDPVVAAPPALAQARNAGMRLAFVTNNAARPPELVAARLTAMGVPAIAAEVTTSAQAAAHFLADVLPIGAPVLVVGGEGLRAALLERGLRPVTSAADRPLAVVQGFDPTVGWSALAEAAVAIRGGARWVATNLDRTIPSPRGALPGNGSLVQALVHALGVAPEATGKPDPTMHRESVERSDARAPVVVGDRLDTDIAGAVAVGAPSLLVLSGIADAHQIVSASPEQRPDYLSRDVSGLLDVHPAVAPGADGSVTAGGWRVTRALAELTLQQTDSVTGDPSASGRAGSDSQLAALRVIAVAAWAQQDAGRSLRIHGGDDPARKALQGWSL